MGEKMIKGVGLNYLENTIVIPHYGESFYSWISNTIKLLNRGKYKLLCLEKDTYFIKDRDQLSVLGKQKVHIIYKKDHHTFSDGDNRPLIITIKSCVEDIILILKKMNFLL